MEKPKERQWWHDAIFYQIYPRSFADGNGDGIGDLPGIISRLDYLAELGVTALWLSPIYASPNHDFGYDIADYRQINPEYGTMEDFHALVAAAKARGMRVIMDLVANHTSLDHPWFHAAQDPTSPYRDYYIWRPGTLGKDGQLQPPNNWTSVFTGTAWQYHEPSGEFYLRLFTPGQPDLNFANPKVVQEVKEIMSFWLDQGVAGFRCDVINLIGKESFADGAHKSSGIGEEHYLSSEMGHRILQELHRDVLGPRGAFTVGEIHKNELPAARAFVSNNELDAVFAFDHTRQGLVLGSMRKKLRTGIRRWQEGLAWNTNFLENHDVWRAVTTYGDEGKWRVQSAQMLATLVLTLRGTPFIYQGQEIGMTNYRFKSLAETHDPVGFMVFELLRKKRVPAVIAERIALKLTRDPVRTPMQWDDSAHAGFTTGEPWLPVHPNYREISVAAELANPDSVLSYYRKLIAFRKQSATLSYGSIAFPKERPEVLTYCRKQGDEEITVLLNLTGRKVKARTQVSGQVVFGNYSDAGLTVTGRIYLRPYEALLIRH